VPKLELDDIENTNQLQNPVFEKPVYSTTTIIKHLASEVVQSVLVVDLLLGFVGTTSQAVTIVLESHSYILGYRYPIPYRIPTTFC
jgi:hypothetical protein